MFYPLIRSACFGYDSQNPVGEIVVLENHTTRVFHANKAETIAAESEVLPCGSTESALPRWPGLESNQIHVELAGVPEGSIKKIDPVAG